MVEFGTSGIRGNVADRVTPALAVAVGQAVGALARERPVGTAAADAADVEATDVDAVGDDTVEAETDGSASRPPDVVVGRDGRPTGAALASAVEAGVASAGATPVRVGRVATPTLAFASRGRYGVVLTASHNPPTDNGIKCFVDGREFDADRERAVERAINGDEAPLADWADWTTPRTEAPTDDYCAAVLEYVRGLDIPAPDGDLTAGAGGEHEADETPSGSDDEPCAGLAVAVDCGNGMAAGTTPAVLDALGADVVALNANVDGRFPGRPSKPTPETLGDLRRFVADGPEDLGIAHDGDADRLVVLDADGEIVHEDTVTAILAGYYTRRAVAERGADEDGEADVPVVLTTPNTSARIDERVAAGGGRVERVALGALHEGVADLTIRGDRVALATEPWKHIHPDFGGWIDGVASAAVLARLVASEGLDALREPVAERPYRKVNVTCPDAAKADAMAELEGSLPAAFPEATAELAYGVRLDFDDGSWLLVRASGTEPYVRLYAESDAVDSLVATATAEIEAAVAAASGGR